MPHSAPDVTTRPSPISRGEWCFVGFIILSGIALRVWWPGHMAVEHFDEGVYASNLFSPPENSYPYRHLYAPALLPALLEWALILGDGAGGSVMAVNVVAGCLMVPSLWWIGRRWFGPTAGLSSALLCGFSDLHILYSRTALTDILLCLWMLWAVYWSWIAIRTGRPAAILVAAVFCALAWWTKYNGWLTLAMSGAGATAWMVSEWIMPRIANRKPVPTPAARTVALRWIAIVVLAVLGWIPYVVTLQGKGGYAAVAANHSRYFVGPSGWGDGLVRQTRNLLCMESWSTLAGFVLAASLTLLSRRGRSRREADAPAGKDHTESLVVGIIVALVVLSAILTGGVTPLLAAFALVGGVAALWTSWVAQSASGEDVGAPDGLATWILAAWFIGLLVATPLYHPYPRLTLPFVVACWLGCGLAADIWCRSIGRATSPLPPGPRIRSTYGIATVLLMGVLGGGITWMSVRSAEHVPPAWEDRRGLKQIAEDILNVLPDQADQLVYVLGEPGLFFHLASQSRSPRRIVLPGGDLESIPDALPEAEGLSFYALLGPHVLTSTDRVDVPDSATVIGEWELDPSTLVLLNEHAPETIATGLESGKLLLIRLAP